MQNFQTGRPDQTLITQLEFAWPRGYKLFHAQVTQLSTKFVLLINIKRQTTVGVSTFISRVNKTPERLRARNFFICQHFSFMSC